MGRVRKQCGALFSRRLGEGVEDLLIEAFVRCPAAHACMRERGSGNRPDVARSDGGEIGWWRARMTPQCPQHRVPPLEPSPTGSNQWRLNGSTSGLPQQIFQNHIVHHPLRHKRLELAVFILKLLQALGIGSIHPTKHGLHFVKCRKAQSMLFAPPGSWQTVMR